MNENMKLGIMCFANNSGLGNQTRRLTQMLRPYRIMVIDSTPFSPNAEQHFDWYEGFQGYKVMGFPQDFEVRKFLRDITHLVVCENPMNLNLFAIARQMGVKTYCMTNYEFCDNLNKPDFPFPDVFLMPSYWKVAEMEHKFPQTKVVYIPPPIDDNEFKRSRQLNFSRGSTHRKFLHVVGTLATNDRNGTLDLLAALPYTKTHFTLRITSQHELPPEYMTQDRRVIYAIGQEVDPAYLYEDADVFVLPRRYGGLSLGCNEALMSGLPVIMPDISPNNDLLPKKWLVPAQKKEELKARAIIDVYQSELVALAEMIDRFATMENKELSQEKFDAYALAHETFSPSELRDKYNALW